MLPATVTLRLPRDRDDHADRKALDTLHRVPDGAKVVIRLGSRCDTTPVGRARPTGGGQAAGCRDIRHQPRRGAELARLDLWGCSMTAPVQLHGEWARHYQDEWQSRAGDPRHPYWLRFAAIAYGFHQDNGHASFKRGEVALILARPDGQGGIAPYVNVGRAVEDAVEYGWLAPESFWGCLVVPAHAINKGNLDSTPPCPTHVRRARRQKVRTLHSVRDSAC